jgi:hypothetical protein
MERAVGWFVLLATALLLFGFAYYIRTTAIRKGWFKTRVPYYTYVDSASGLNVGDPIKMMGKEIGRISYIETQPPDDWEHNVYLKFEIIEPHDGYLWTRGTYAKVTSGLLEKRALEVTKGTNGYAIYLYHPMRGLTLSEAEQISQPEKWWLASEYYEQSATNLNMVLKARTPLGKDTLAKLRQLGVQKLFALDSREKQKSPTVVWDDQKGSYVKFFAESDLKTGIKANVYHVVADEAPAVSDRVESLVRQVEGALPGIFGLTNRIGSVLGNTVNLTSNLNTTALAMQPVASNLNYLTAQLRGPGALGEWLLGTNGQQQLSSTLDSAHTTLSSVDTNLIALFENVGRSLDNLADMTSNLNAQVKANTNMLSSISKSVTDTDDLVQGLKRHWFLRSAFKPSKTNAPAKK